MLGVVEGVGVADAFRLRSPERLGAITTLWRRPTGRASGLTWAAFLFDCVRARERTEHEEGGLYVHVEWIYSLLQVMVRRQTPGSSTYTQINQWNTGSVTAGEERNYLLCLSATFGVHEMSQSTGKISRQIK